MTIKLYRKYLMHDMRQLTVRYGKARFDGEKQMESQIGVGASDVELMERFIHTGVGYLRKKLRKILTEFETDDDDKQDKTETIAEEEDYDEETARSWSFVLKETDEDGVTIDGFAMAKLMHWFIVKWAMWQWLQMWSPTEASIAKLELDELEEEIDDAVWDFNLAMPTKVHRPSDEETSTTEIVFTYGE